jgi:hypothetical protein
VAAGQGELIGGGVRGILHGLVGQWLHGDGLGQPHGGRDAARRWLLAADLREMQRRWLLAADLRWKS